MSEHTSYDLAVIGTGPGGVCAARFGARLGARVVMIDVSAVHKAGGYFFGSHQVDTIVGKASLKSHHQIKVGTRTITAKKILIATGSKPHIPAITGLKRAAYYTIDTLETITRRPRRLIILGGGPAGIEQAFAFARRGSQVTIIEHNSHILESVDSDARQLVSDELHRAGITIYTSASVPRITTKGTTTLVHISQFNAALEVPATMILVATGYLPHVPAGLRAASVHKNDRGIVVNADWQTTNHDIYAIGRAAAAPGATEQAAAEAVVQDLFGTTKARLAIEQPFVLPTRPAIAQVGPTETWLQLQDVQYQTYHLDFSDIEGRRGRESGFLKVLVDPRGGIISATIAGSMAGELIGYFATALEHHQKLSALHNLPLPPSTIASGIRQIALQAYFDDIERPSLSWRLLHTIRAKL